MSSIHSLFSACGVYAPWVALAVFLLASAMIIWRLEALSAQGVEGTVLGTLFMPYCSGIGNIIFALILGARGGNGNDVAINCVFNNITNMTLLIGLPVLIWSMQPVPKKGSRKKVREAQSGRLALVLNLVAAIFFCLISWALLKDGQMDRFDGIVMLATFLFWQCFHIYDVKKSNLIQNKQYPRGMVFDAALLLNGAFLIYISTSWLVQWFEAMDSTSVPKDLLGWLSGVLMVLPNALLAVYYGYRRRLDVVYISQSGDAHICVPLCLGLFCLFKPIDATGFILFALLLQIGLNVVHLLFAGLFGRLPRAAALALLVTYAVFLIRGFS
ncbi:MAG: hypothetical protein K9M45_07570 [Kiritimatiellales bacterium]|nr:hypothetical protein [Kiritimatiellales bacterium]